MSGRLFFTKGGSSLAGSARWCSAASNINGQRLRPRTGRRVKGLFRLRCRPMAKYSFGGEKNKTRRTSSWQVQRRDSPSRRSEICLRFVHSFGLSCPTETPRAEVGRSGHLRFMVTTFHMNAYCQMISSFASTYHFGEKTRKGLE